VIVKSPMGDRRAEHLFTLRQSLAAYRSYRSFTDDCEREMHGERGQGFALGVVAVMACVTTKPGFTAASRCATRLGASSFYPALRRQRNLDRNLPMHQ
jgi:hypothetical protein